MNGRLLEKDAISDRVYTALTHPLQLADHALDHRKPEAPEGWILRGAAERRERLRVEVPPPTEDHKPLRRTTDGMQKLHFDGVRAWETPLSASPCFPLAGACYLPVMVELSPCYCPVPTARPFVAQDVVNKRLSAE
jgi:hypothetical protein